MQHDVAPFNRPRTIGGLLLISAAVVLLTIDAFNVEYSVDTVTLALLLGTASVLLGVEGIRRVIDGTRD